MPEIGTSITLEQQAHSLKEEVRSFLFGEVLPLVRLAQRPDVMFMLSDVEQQRPKRLWAQFNRHNWDGDIEDKPEKVLEHCRWAVKHLSAARMQMRGWKQMVLKKVDQMDTHVGKMSHKQSNQSKGRRPSRPPRGKKGPMPSRDNS